jgi:polyisoprenoid-binding protein YceI
MSVPSTQHSRGLGEAVSGRWELDPQRSRVGFRVPHFWGLVAVKGHFDQYGGHLDLTPDPPIELTINAATLRTGNRKRDQHLRSADFFDTDSHPHVRFISNGCEQQGDALKVRGRLFARDRSIPLELTAQLRHANGDLEIEATTTAPHHELGMTWSPLGMIGSRSELFIKGHLTRAKPPRD